MVESTSRPKLGDILTRLQLIDDDQVAAALAHQSRSGKLFGESLLDLGFIGQDDLSWALSSQLGLPYMAVTPEMADPELLIRFPADFLKRNLVLPLVASDASLSVVLADPTDHTVMSRLERMAGKELSVAVGTPAAIRGALESVLGANRDPAEGLLQEVTDQGPPASLSSPELATLVDRALTHGAVMVHLDPDGDEVRVRFRDRAGLLLDGGAFDPHTLRQLTQSLTNWLGKGATSAPGISAWGETPEQAENLPFRVLALSSAQGTSLTLLLDGIAPGRDSLDAAFEEDWTRLDELLVRPTGLVLGVAPTLQGGELLMNRILRHLDLRDRRACAAVGSRVQVPKGTIRFGEEPAPDSARGLARLEGIDVMVGVFDDPSLLGALADAAARDRMVIAGLPGNGALGFLARSIESGIAATLLAECLLAVVAQQILPPTEDDPARVVTETLFVDPPLRRALQEGGTIDSLRRAARDQGFVEIGARLHGLENVDAAIVQHFERHRYLEDAA